MILSLNKSKSDWFGIIAIRLIPYRTRIYDLKIGKITCLQNKICWCFSSDMLMNYNTPMSNCRGIFHFDFLSFSKALTMTHTLHLLFYCPPLVVCSIVGGNLKGLFDQREMCLCPQKWSFFKNKIENVMFCFVASISGYSSDTS